MHFILDINAQEVGLPPAEKDPQTKFLHSSKRQAGPGPDKLPQGLCHPVGCSGAHLGASLLKSHGVSASKQVLN